MEDLIIVGAGPAGISAALYAVRGNVTPLVLYHDAGALEKAEKIENFYGNADFLSGSELQQKGISQAKKLGVRFQKTQVLAIGGLDTFLVKTTLGEWQARSVILATGARRTAPKLPGIKELEGRGVSYCAVCDAFFYRQKEVAVLGNQSFALHEANELAAVAKKVTILTHGLPLDTREKEIPFPVEKRPIARIKGADRIQSVEFQDGEELAVDGLFIAIGTAGTTEIARQMGAALTEKGHILVNEQMETTLPGLYAAGDCTGGLLQITKAAYEGTLAGISAARYVKKQKQKKK